MKQPLTGKELEYIADSMSNEDLLIKQCAVAAATVTNPGVQSTCASMISAHQTNYAMLLDAVAQHQQLAPAQPQS